MSQQFELVSTPLGEYLDVNETAKRLGISASFLNKARLTGDGPSFLKIGKTVRYEWSTVLKWLEEQTRRSTSESREVA
jgi:predicted DNA-binding transcriptional regulator AlpA